ncbi:hypothetical protein ES702_01969 [subsurface metagenome]
MPSWKMAFAHTQKPMGLVVTIILSMILSRYPKMRSLTVYAQNGDGEETEMTGSLYG